MFTVRSLLVPAIVFSALSLLQACSDAGDSPAPTEPAVLDEV